MDFTIAYVGFLFIFIIYRIQQLGKAYKFEPRPGKVFAKISYSLILSLYLLIAIGTIFEYFYCRYIIFLRQEVNLIISGIGLLMYVGVIPLRAKAIEALGIYMSPDIKILDDHKLICHGPYRYLRHPLSLYVMIEIIGFTLIPNSYFSLLMALIIFCPMILYRAYLEEKTLIKKIGQEYIDYKKKVCAFIPISKKLMTIGKESEYKRSKESSKS